MFFAVFVGYGAMAQFAISNIVVQSESDTRMRGRVIGIMLMALFGMMPLGSLIVGAVSQRIGAPATVLGQGIICLIIILFFMKFLLNPKTLKTKTKDFSILETEELIEEQLH